MNTHGLFVSLIAFRASRKSLTTFDNFLSSPLPHIPSRYWSTPINFFAAVLIASFISAFYTVNISHLCCRVVGFEYIKFDALSGSELLFIKDCDLCIDYVLSAAGVDLSEFIKFERGDINGKQKYI